MMYDFIRRTYRGPFTQIETRADRAESKARALLTRLLTDSQRWTFQHGRYIDVKAKSGRTYRIYCRDSREQNIYWIENNQTQAMFCASPGGDIPIFDAFLGQMLLIATDEVKFLRVAESFGRDPW